MYEEGHPRSRMDGFPTPLIASKNLFEAPKVFLFVQNDEFQLS